jgi:acetyltransferase-like isoleucine patch superfamily enzyme
VNLSDLRSTGVLAVVRRELRPFFGELRRLYFVHVWGMEIGRECRISFSAKLDKSYPRGIHIGEGTAINFGACVLTHDTPRGVHADTWIGKDCNIGANSIIMPGIRIGDNCVVAAASVVMKDVPSNSLVAGNPARIMEKGIKTRRLGIIDRTVRPDFGTPSPVPDEPAPEKAAS